MPDSAEVITHSASLVVTPQLEKTSTGLDYAADAQVQEDVIAIVQEETDRLHLPENVQAAAKRFARGRFARKYFAHFSRD